MQISAKWCVDCLYVGRNNAKRNFKNGSNTRIALQCSYTLSSLIELGDR